MQVIELFKKLCTIPHCSHQADAMRHYLETVMRSHGYAVHSDAAGNILGRVEGAAVTLQAHYDMVCIGKAPELELYEASGWLRAKGSTLGADNGIAMAMMLAMMQEGRKVDLLFTADEEVGLIGARALAVEIRTPFLLNLDSEEEGVVTIGCAGGVDIIATLPITWEEETGYLYQTEIGGLPGGHSGVDIDKEIPNAIKLLAERLVGLDQPKLIAISGGERRNAIAKSAAAGLMCLAEQDADDLLGLGRQRAKVIRESGDIIRMLREFEHGVRSFNDELGIVDTSINLAQITMLEDAITIHLSARSMRRDALVSIGKETVDYFCRYGCDVVTEGFYAPWKPEQTPFSERVMKHVEVHTGRSALGAIHAGLECGIIKEKYPALDMASIGPTIIYPHSTREAVELASVERVYATVASIIDDLA